MRNWLIIDPDGDATGREWRTAPLWGTRLIAEFLDGTSFFLHDGRATTLESAIRAHGGEATECKGSVFQFIRYRSTGCYRLSQVTLILI